MTAQAAGAHSGQVIVLTGPPGAGKSTAGGYQVICDGIVGPWFLAPFRGRSVAAGLPLHYVVLRPDQATTLSRAAGRGGQALTDREPVLSLHRQFAELGGLEAHALDSTGQSAASTAHAVRRGLAAGSYLLAGLQAES